MYARSRLIVLVVVFIVTALAPSAAQAVAGAQPLIADITTWATKTIPVPANDLAYDTFRDVLVATVPSSNPSLGNELVELDPETGAIGRHAYVGSNPGAIALTDDGTTAYVGLRGVNRIARVDLATFSLAETFSTGADSFFGPRYVEDIEAVPGRNDVVVASLQKPAFSPRHEGVWVFEDGVALANRTPGHTGANRFEMADATTAYGYNNETTEFGFRSIAVSPAGATVTSVGSSAIAGFYLDIEYAMGWIYSTSGLIIDPVTRNAVGSFAGGLFEVTPTDNRVTVLNGDQVSIFNATTGQPVESRTFAEVTPSPTTLVASGTGFAAAGGMGVTLLGPLAGGGPVTLPAPPPSTIAGLTVTDVALATNGLEYDDVRERLYASVPSSAPLWTNQVVALDPETGEVLASLFVGSNPGPLAISADRSTLYVGLNTIGRVVRIDLTTFLSVSSFSLGNAPFGGGPLVAEDIEVRPGANDTVALSLTASGSPRHQGVAIYSGGVRLPDVTPGHTGANRIEFADASTLYGTNNETTGFEFFRMVVDSSGVRRTATTGYLLPGFGLDITLAGGMIHATNGSVVDPAKSELIGRFETTGPVAVDVSAERAYFAQGSTLREFDLANFRAVGERPIGVSGTPGSLVTTARGFAVRLSGGRIALLTRPLPVDGARFNPVVPARILDTGAGTGAPLAKLGSDATLDVQVTGQGGVPATGVSAVVVNITAVDPTAASFLTAWPAGLPRPVASNLNVVPGRTVSNLVAVKVGPDGKISLYNHAGSTHLEADVSGWYGEVGSLTGSRFHALVHERILDTRIGTGAPTATVGAGGVLDVQITGQGGVPASGVSAVALNVTAVEPTAASSLTAWPTGVARPVEANVNFVSGQTLANLVVVKLGDRGRISLHNQAGSIDVVADVVGWYGDDAGSTGALHSSVTPSRILDTRFGIGAPPATVGPGGVLNLRVTGRRGVPATGVSAVVLNVTAVDTTAAGFLTAWPAGVARPVASSLNHGSGQTVPNLVVVQVGEEGYVSLFNHAGQTHLTADVTGWFNDE